MHHYWSYEFWQYWSFFVSSHLGIVWSSKCPSKRRSRRRPSVLGNRTKPNSIGHGLAGCQGAKSIEWSQSQKHSHGNERNNNDQKKQKRCEERQMKTGTEKGCIFHLACAALEKPLEAVLQQVQVAVLPRPVNPMWSLPNQNDSVQADFHVPHFLHGKSCWVTRSLQNRIPWLERFSLSKVPSPSFQPIATVPELVLFYNSAAGDRHPQILEMIRTPQNGWASRELQKRIELKCHLKIEEIVERITIFSALLALLVQNDPNVRELFKIPDCCHNYFRPARGFLGSLRNGVFLRAKLHHDFTDLQVWQLQLWIRWEHHGELHGFWWENDMIHCAFDGHFHLGPDLRAALISWGQK